MLTYLARPGMAQAGHYERLAYPLGQQQAIKLGETLAHDFGIEVLETPVATGNLWRSRETAQEAGFRHVNSYGELDDVWFDDSQSVLSCIRIGSAIPRPLRERVETIIGNPPPEQVWIVDAMIIASLCVALEINRGTCYFPAYGEVVEIPLN